MHPAIAHILPFLCRASAQDRYAIITTLANVMMQENGGCINELTALAAGDVPVVVVCARGKNATKVVRDCLERSINDLSFLQDIQAVTFDVVEEGEKHEPERDRY